MTSSGCTDLDFIEELRLRRWARENYVPAPSRNGGWHPVVLEEMTKKDRDLNEILPTPTYAWSGN